MTSEQYRRKVEGYLKTHLDHQIIQRLRNHESVTQTELAGLEKSLVDIGEDDGEELLVGLLAKSESPSLAHFILRMVGMDRTAAQSAFSTFLNDESLTPKQIRFVELIIDQLTSRGPDELFANKTNVIDGIFGYIEKLSESLLKRNLNG